MVGGDNTRQRIEQAALSLFVEKTVDGTTIKDIAQAAGLSDGALYRHFPSKEALVTGLYHQHYGAFAQTLVAIEQKENSLADKLRALIVECCKLFDENRDLFSFLLLYQHSQLRKIGPMVSSPVDVVAGIFTREISSKRFSFPDATLAAAIVMGMVIQAAAFKIYGRLDGKLTDHTPALVQAALRALNI